VLDCDIYICIYICVFVCVRVCVCVCVCVCVEYCAGSKIEKNEMDGACGAYGGGLNRGLVGKLEVKRPLGRPRRRWEDNIKMDLQELGGGCGDWTELAQDRDRWRALVSTVLNLRVPKMRGIS